jgi:methylated-DNA-protein-cysteine methyltransferase-like protein
MNFFEQVYAIALKIPHGRVTSYGAIAAAIGSKGSSRMVGYAMAESHHQEHRIPAHRVVNRNGILTGKHHFGNDNEMQKRLELEGHIIVDDKIKGFSEAFWDPMTELEL